MAAIKEILEIEQSRESAEDWRKIHLFQEGSFYRAYEVSAWLAAITVRPGFMASRISTICVRSRTWFLGEVPACICRFPEPTHADSQTQRRKSEGGVTYPDIGLLLQFSWKRTKISTCQTGVWIYPYFKNPTGKKYFSNWIFVFSLLGAKK